MTTTEPLCHRTGKLRHASRNAASKAAQAVKGRRRGANNPASLSPYLCRACGGWHLGRKR